MDDRSLTCYAFKGLAQGGPSGSDPQQGALTLRSDMTTVPTCDTPKPLTDLEIVTAFARKTAQSGEMPRVHHLWDNHYRINCYLDSEKRIGRSLFVTLSGGEIKIAEVP